MESNLRHLIAKMTKEKCILCGKETVSVIKTGTDFMCYNCYADQRNPTRSKEVHNNEEARIQTEFFKLIPLYFPIYLTNLYLPFRTVEAVIYVKLLT